MACPLRPTGSVSEDLESGSATEVNYQDYLKVKELLTLQQPRSAVLGKNGAVHDEHLFIVIHQVYELWFKQILHELGSVMDILSAKILEENQMLIINSRVTRITVILKVLVEQIKVLETMTPLDFLEFRHLLVPASGYQSLQFRLLEVKLGVQEANRINYGSETFRTPFETFPDMKKKLEEACSNPSLLDLVQRWLSRTPGLGEEFDFWSKYSVTIKDMLEEQRQQAETETHPRIKEQKAKDYESQKVFFKQILEEGEHNTLVKKGVRRLSHKAMQGALMITLYRDEPRFQTGYQFISLLMDVDTLLMQWRNNHSLFVQRIIGSKVGTGGSSGYQYLRATVSDRYKIFVDFFNLSSFVVPRCRIPPLSVEMKDLLYVHFVTSESEQRFARRLLPHLEHTTGPLEKETN